MCLNIRKMLISKRCRLKDLLHYKWHRKGRMRCKCLHLLEEIYKLMYSHRLDSRLLRLTCKWHMRENMLYKIKRIFKFFLNFIRKN